ncbi:abnormal spindle-like microcephaly-associated protein [Patagioenas fasciata monilis]|uniref:Abnormal spindle-like microcephaly-associated protein n=1 Tax=Patagioenas fasciata monilis TaxID=372326 RepID=A0A1V4JYA6_PATFA|nr:abnormal spindle-like microcephaly-associated protein [Patagioenas fasciata monilis]
MAAGFFSGAALWEPSSTASPTRRRWAARRGEEDGDEGPVVLVLSHFSRPPFLSFGSLRVGASRTRLLGIDNPNAEDADVVVDRFPASARGFSIEHRRFPVQSGQRIFVAVTWTPLEEGKVRELVTFVINGIIKHQAVLLGVAEVSLKKKKSLWDTIKKKNSSETSASTKVKKSTLKDKNVNKTFQVSQKVDRLRSPLQPCENQNTVQNSTSPGNDPFVGSENKLPISPIAPVLEECRTPVGTPLAMRRSTTFADIATTVHELLPKLDGCNVKKIVHEHNELKSESVYNSIGLAQLPASNNRVLNCTLSPVCPPEHSESVPALSTRRILSPDSFVNGSYQADIDTIRPSVPILSPDQFVKDSLLDKQSKTPKLEAALISATTETYVVKKRLPSKWKKCGDAETQTHIHIEHNLNEAFEVHDVESQVLHCDQARGNPFNFPSAEDLQTQNSSWRKQPKKRPVLSATVIKNKPTPAEENYIQPKSKKCLSKAIMECANVVSVHTKAEISKRLPVIGPISAENKCQNDKVRSSPTGSTSWSHKRKSETYAENSRVTDLVDVEEVERKRTRRFGVDNKMNTTMRPSAFKPTNRERAGQRKKAGSSLQKASKTTNRISKPIPGLAQSHLTFVKPLKTVIPRHPMPFAAKNMFYDERWKEKQQRGFTWWLNFVLTPDDFSVKTNTPQVNAAALILGEENHHKTSVPKAPTKDEASLKAYTAHRKLNKLRRDACRLFTSETMVKAIKKLEVEIETRRLLVRRDRHLWKDVGERQKVLNWLLSYNPLWLRIGLETVYGELIALESNSDVMGLAIFILNRLLWNPDIAAEYRHPSVPHLYREGHEEALSKFTLKKLLLLVCFLDYAKRSRMIDHDPCLFCKDAEFKTSRDLLLAFSRDFLSGEGDLSRHLGFLGLPVSHIQTPLDEFDFAVTNLAVDLQCGIRLVRTMELLTKNWSLSKQLRVPAISRLQKMHNVDIVLNVLKERGIHLKDESGASIDSRDIVDRHRERTLALLWKIVFAFQVDVFLNVEQLKEEIEFLKIAYKKKTQLGALKTSLNCCRVEDDNSNNSSPQSYSTTVRLLMAWVNAVCGFYNIKVENFTVCFSDGRVLCHLIHHYHPCYVPLEAVCQRTTQTVECSRTRIVGLNSSSSSSSESDTSLNVTEGMFDQTVTASDLYKELLDNERKNFQLINAAVSDLGGIPAMIHHSDMSNTIPDEKVVITYLSFLCSRLLDLRQETRAAWLIQSAWRNYRLKRELKLSQERDKAARIIQKSVLNFLSRRRILKKVNAAIFIQKYWRRYLARMFFLNLKRTKLEEVRSKSATVIQAYWRRYAARKRYLQLRYYVTFVQARIRMKMRRAAVVLQSAYRGLKARKEAHILRSVIKIQAACRGLKVRQDLKTMHQSAAIIQSYYRMHKQQRDFRKLLLATRRIQQWFRACKERNTQLRNYTIMKRATLRIQAAFRGRKTRRLIITMKTRRNIIIVQARVRGFIEKKRFHKIKENTIKIQAFFRGFIQRQKYLQCRFSAILIQQHYRAHQMRNIEQRRYHQMKKAAIRIQASYRGYKTRQWVNKIRAAQVIQAWFRGCRARKKYASVVKATRIIQNHFKTKQQRTRFLKMKSCALTIQRRWRATLTARMVRHQFLAIKNAAVKIQLVYRQYRTKRLLRKKLQAACLIQNAYRGFKARRKLDQQKAAALIIQKHLRAWQEGKHQFMKYNKTRKAVIKLQALIRGYLVRKKISEQKQQKKLLYFTAAAYHHISAIKIQRAYRIHLILKLAQNRISSVLIIQKWFRAKMQQKRFLRDCQRIIQLQRVVRGWLNHRNDAATIIQRNVRRFLACRRRRKFAVGIVKFQALWRGYSWRKSNDTAKTRALRHSLEKANENSREENKLCNRTAIAIEYLLKYKHLSYILAALKHLEVATRLSPLCCENMAQSRAILTIFVLIRSCNRSVPCMDVIRYSVQVLLNVSKYERTTQAVYEAENSIDTLLDLLQMYRGKAGDKVSEKGGSIFTKTCCLLAILSKDSKRALEIRSMPRAVTCIQSIYKLTARKHKMDAERTLVKQKTNTLSGTSSVPVTPLRIKTVSRIKPDWVLRRDNMQEVVDPLQAILMVMDTLVTMYSGKLFAEDKPCDLPHIENGKIAQYYYSFKSYYFPMHKEKKLSYSCMIGYTTESGTQDGRITCTAKGWSPVPRCYKKCSKPLLENGFFYESCQVPNLHHGSYFTDRQELRLNETLLYRCDEGYHTAGGNTTEEAVCLTHGWSLPPNCTKITCSSLSAIAHGGFYPVKKIYEEGDVVHFFCEENYSVSVFDLIQCYYFGWYPDPPVCEDVKNKCPPPPLPPHAHVITVKRTYHNGDKVRIQCQNTVETEIQCVEGKWSSPPICIGAMDKWEPEAPPPLKAQAAVRTSKTYHEEDTKMQQNCTSPPVIKNGVLLGPLLTSYKNGSSVEYSCQRYHFLEGPSTVYCEQGNWTEQPMCLEPCALNVTDLDSNNIELKWRQEELIFLHGDLVEFECKQGYNFLQTTILSPGRTQCNHGRLKYPKCILQAPTEKCDSPPSIANGALTLPPLTQYDSGSSVQYSCSDYHFLQGSETIYCSEGQWTSPPVCIEPCTLSKDEMEKNNVLLQGFYETQVYFYHGDYVGFYCKQNHFGAESGNPIGKVRSL